MKNTEETTIKYPGDYYASESECKNNKFRSSDFNKSTLVEDAPGSGRFHRRLKYNIYNNDPVLGPTKETRTIRSIIF